MASIKKVVKSKGAARKMAVMVQVDGKILITTTQVASSSPGISTKFT